MAPDVTEGIIGSGHIQPGAIDLDLFAETIIPPRVLGSLPTLPDEDYAEGSLVFLTSDGKLYRNVADAWTTAVDGADIVANSITAGQIAAGAIGTTELAADAIIANVANVGGTVTIDDTGITIADEFGETGLTASGFAGSWWDFLASGLYNNQFRVGAFGSLLGSFNPSGVEVPYWSFGTQTHEELTITRVAESGAGGGALMVVESSVDTPGVATLAGLHQPKQRVQAGRAVTARVAWRAVGATLSSPETIRFGFNFYDKDEVGISSTSVNLESRTTTGAAGDYEWDQTEPVIAPVNAAYIILTVGGYWPIGIEDFTTQSIEIAEVAMETGGTDFRELVFNEDVALSWLSAGILDVSSSVDDLMLRLLPPGGTGQAGLVVGVDGDSTERVFLGIVSGDPTMLVTNGAGGTDILEVDGSISFGVYQSESQAINIGDNYILFNAIANGSAEPSNPAAGRVKWYAKVNGSGKTEVRARFDSGAFVTVVTEP